MNIGERKFVKRTQVVLIECVAHDSSNVNDARDRIEKETILVATGVNIPAQFVSDTIKQVLA